MALIIINLKKYRIHTEFLVLYILRIYIQKAFLTYYFFVGSKNKDEGNYETKIQ